MALAAGLALLALLASMAAASSAFAATAFDRFIFDRPLPGAPDGAGGQHSGLRDVAVNEEGAGLADPGDIYVADTGNDRIQVFDAAGHFKFAFGRDVIATGAAGDLGDAFEKCTVAVACQRGTIGSSGGMFSGATGVAVNQATGDVYVRDVPNGPGGRVQQFDAGGGFIRAWGWDVVQPGGEGDDTTPPINEFEICSVASQCQRGPDGVGIGQLAGSSGGTGIAVSPVDGDVFVADPGRTSVPARRVQRFNSDGTSPEVIGSVANFGSANVSQPLHVAVDAAGILYASDSNSSNQIDRYDTNTSSFIASIGAPPLLVNTSTSSGGTLGLEVDPDSDGAGTDVDILYVLRDPSTGSTVIQQFGPLNPPGAAAPPAAADDAHGGSTFGTSSSNGLGINSATGTLYATMTAGAAGPGVYAFDGDGTGTAIAAAIDAPTDVSSTAASLNGSVDPANGLVRARFQYSSDGVEWNPLPVLPVSGSGVHDVSADLTGLDPSTFYRARVVVEKVLAPNSTISETSAETIFLTDSAPPLATTLPVGQRGDTTAQLRAAIDPNGSATTYRFEYGPEGGGFDRFAPIPDGNAGAGNVPVTVVQDIAGLLPETRYHYRIVATNPSGSDSGEPIAFETQSTSQPSSPVARDYELVSPANKVGGVGVGPWYTGPSNFVYAGFAGQDGERFAAGGALGSVLVEGAQAYASDWALAERAGGDVGWQSKSPFSHPTAGNAFAQSMIPHAASGDLSTMAWRTNAATTLMFPEMAADGPTWQLFNTSFLGSWGTASASPRWEIFGPRDLGLLAPGVLDSSASDSDNLLWDIAFSRDGSHAVGVTDLEDHNAPRLPAVRGLAGASDPTSASWPDLVSGRSVYSADFSTGLADSFAGSDRRELVNACTGVAGVDRTEIPSVTGGGDLAAQECAGALVGRDSHLVSEHGATLKAGDAAPDGANDGRLKNVVSEDGSRVFFMSPDPLATGVPNGLDTFCSGSGSTTLCPTQLYVRQRNAGGSFTTRWISRPAAGLFGSQDATLTGTVRFEGASSDGDKVFFRTNSPLTPNDTNGTCGAPCTSGTPSASSWDLFMYDLPDGVDGDPSTPDANPGGGTLTRISAGPDDTGDCNSPVSGADSEENAVAALRFAADDGSRAYFTCAAPLSGVASPSSGTITLPGGAAGATDAANLYVYDAHEPQADDRWRFIARLPRATGASGLAPIDSCATTAANTFAPLGSDVAQDPAVRFFRSPADCVRGTSDGSFVTFWTRGRLTSDDPPAPDTADIYAYDAVADELTRITAPQGGVGGTYPCGTADDAAGIECFGDGGFDFLFTSPRPPMPSLGVATDPLVAGDRIAFFQSKARLVPEDVDAAYDVYQWRNGDLSLISTGSSTSDGAFYKGNDRTGRDVYFGTLDDLSWQDVDVVADIYTARIGGGIPEPPPPPICPVLAGVCQGAGASPPTTPSIGSATPVAVENATPPPRKAKGGGRKAKRCPKGKVKRKVRGKKRCITRKRARRLQRAKAKRAVRRPK